MSARCLGCRWIGRRRPVPPHTCKIRFVVAPTLEAVLRLYDGTDGMIARATAKGAARRAAYAGLGATLYAYGPDGSCERIEVYRRTPAGGVDVQAY